MAKSSGFFSKRRGSAGSLTFSVLNGKQITKEKITSMSNPKTQYQARQRMILSISSKLTSQLRGIVDHSFEGVAYGNKSVIYFQSLASKDSGSRDFFPIAKGEAGFQPKAVQISQGTLQRIGAIVLAQTSLRLENLNNDDVANAASFFESNPQLKEGDQLTVVAVVNTPSPDSENPIQIDAQDNKVVIDRVVLDASNLEDISAVGTENGSFSFDFTKRECAYNAVSAQEKIIAAAVILSSKDVAAGKWRRSTETLALTTNYNTMSWYEQYNNDLASFMKAAGAMNSDRYLNQAEDVQQAEVLYSNPIAFAEGAPLDENTRLFLAVNGSDGKMHYVVTEDRKMYSKELSDLDIVPAVREFAPTADPKPANSYKVSFTPSLKWEGQEATAQPSSAVVPAEELGEDVKYIDVINVLVNA